MRAFIFDMDGVIVDSEAVHSRTKLATFRHYGIPFDERRLAEYMGRTSRALFADALQECGQEDGPEVAELIAYKHQLYLDILRDGTDVKAIAGTLQLIGKLRQAEIPLAVASSAGSLIIRAVLQKLSLAGAFKVIVSGADLPKGKPDPAVYLAAAEKLGERPADCIVLEDAASGVAAAKQAGMYCIAYRNPGSGKQDLSHADHIVDDIGSIDISRL